MRRRIVLLLLLAMTIPACRSPGEPPRHPDDATYRDLIRREVSTVISSLGSVELVAAQARAGDITTIYARVGLEQSANDLAGVATDLAEITPPNGRATAHRHLQAIVESDLRRLRAAARRWPDGTGLKRLGALTAADDQLVSGPLSDALGA